MSGLWGGGGRGRTEDVDEGLVEALRAYDRDWFTPAADALADGRIDAVSLVLTGDSHYAHYRVTRRELAIGPFGWLRRFSRPRTLRDALSPLSMAA